MGESSEEDLADRATQQNSWKRQEEHNHLLVNRFLDKKPTDMLNTAPPPYSEVEALQQKQARVVAKTAPGWVSHGLERTTLRSLTPNSTVLAVSSSSTSPNQPQFIRTRSDEPGMANWAGLGGDSPHNLRMVESTSEETLVESTSFQDLHLAGSISMGASGSQASPQQSSPHLRNRHSYPGERQQQPPMPISLTNSLSRHPPIFSATFLTHKQGDVHHGKEADLQAHMAHSQNSYAYAEGLSPDASETGDHSAEADLEPREVEIHKGSGALGERNMRLESRVWLGSSDTEGRLCIYALLM